jgi:hypothetical protein
VAKNISAQSDVLLQKLGDEAVLLNLRTETYYMLNATGIRMWEVLTKAESIESALEILLGEYDVPLNVLREDVGELIDNLAQAELVHIHE